MTPEEMKDRLGLDTGEFFPEIQKEEGKWYLTIALRGTRVKLNALSFERRKMLARQLIESICD